MQPRYSPFVLTVICFFAFFLFGITDNLKGPTLPSVIKELDIQYREGGNILFGEYVGFLIATLITGILADKYGLKLVIVLAGILLAIGVGGYSSLGTVFGLSASLFIVGLGLGAFELGPNAVIVNLYHEQKGLYLNLMAVMHGLGSMLAPLFASFLFSLGSDWREVFRWDLLLIVIFVLFSLSSRFPRAAERSSLDFRSIPRIAFDRRMSFFYAAMMSYVASEIGLASWMVVYLQDVRDMNGNASNSYLALFFGLLMMGRFLGSLVVKKLGYLRSILISSLLAVLCTLFGIYSPYVFFLPLTGFFFSIIFPTITAAVSDERTENINTILGVLFTFSGLGGVIGPWLTGWIGDIHGLQAGMGVILILSALTLFFIVILNKRNRNEQRH